MVEYLAVELVAGVEQVAAVVLVVEVELVAGIEKVAVVELVAGVVLVVGVALVVGIELVAGVALVVGIELVAVGLVQLVPYLCLLPVVMTGTAVLACIVSAATSLVVVGRSYPCPY